MQGVNCKTASLLHCGIIVAETVLWRGRYEGAQCDVDINECVRGTAGCVTNAACVNSNGGYTCQCYWGFSGACPLLVVLNVHISAHVSLQ